ncbi:unnamed protein product [Closterium sp. NIES-53]
MILSDSCCTGVAHKGYHPVKGPPNSSLPVTRYPAHNTLPCPSRCPALPVAPPCPARRAALLAARHPAGCRAALPCLSRRPACRALPCPCTSAALLVTRDPGLPAMATLNVLTFDPEGRLIQFDTWLDDLQLYLLSDSRDSVSLFDHTSGASFAPFDTADNATRSQWLTRDAAARLAVRNHLPLTERTHFGQHKTAKALNDVVVACYSSPATAALGRLILPYLFPELSAFATVEDLITHLRTSDTRYRAALKAKFLDKNPPPIAALLVTRDPGLPTMATLNVLTFDPEGRLIQFDTWLDDLQLYLLSDSRDSVSLFDHTPGASFAPFDTADNATRSQWLTRDAAARLAVRNHLPLTERTHFGQQKTAKALNDVVVARYSSPATAALGRLILPYLFPELSAFATVEDLITHLRTSDTRYRAALKAKFLDKNPPPMYITLYFIFIRL